MNTKDPTQLAQGLVELNIIHGEYNLGLWASIPLSQCRKSQAVSRSDRQTDYQLHS
jgi:hypothetical protein